MSFLKRLFGLGGGDAAIAPAAEESRQFNGYVITAAPMRDGAQWRLAGVITKDFDGAKRVHRFIRADVFSDRADAVNFALQKGELIISQSGDSIFS